MKLIDAELVLTMLKAFKDEKYGNPHFMNGIATVLELIEDMPEAVVRCKDCRLTDEPIYEKDEHDYWCREHSLYVYENDYCSYGERREDGVDR